MPRTLFKSAKVGEHIKEVSRVAGFYANTRREMNLTSLSDAPEKNAPAAALRTAQCRAREKFFILLYPKDSAPARQLARMETAKSGPALCGALAELGRAVACALGPLPEPVIFQPQGKVSSEQRSNRWRGLGLAPCLGSGGGKVTASAVRFAAITPRAFMAGAGGLICAGG